MASVITNTAISVTGRFGGVVIGLVITGILGRVLGVERFGDYSLLLSFGAILHIITDGGLYLTLVREISKDVSRSQETLEAISGLRVSLFFVVFVLGALVLVALPGYRSFIPLYVVAALGFLFQSLSQLLMAVFQTQAVMWRASMGDIVGRVVQLIGVGVLALGLFMEVNIVMLAMAAFVAGAGAAYGVHALLIPKNMKAWRFAASPTRWRSVIAQSWPLGLMLILNAIYFRTDMLMISWFRSSYEVGLYGFAYRIIESALFFPAAFGGLLLPRIVAAKSSRERSHLLEQALLVMLVVGGLVYALIPSLSQDISVLLVGADFIQAGPILATLVAALVIMFFGNIFGFALVAFEEQKALLKLYAWLALGNVIANFIFIPQFGAVAAAWTTVLTEATAALVAGVLVAKHAPYALAWRAIGVVGLITLLVSVFVSVSVGVVHTLAILVIGTCLYTGLVVALRVIHPEHIALLLKPHDRL